MLIMLRRASASRCRTQVTSNVRHPRTKAQRQDVHFGKVPPELFFAKAARAEGRSRLASRSFAAWSGNSNHKSQRVAQAAPQQSPAWLGPSMVRQAGQTPSQCSRWLPLFRRKAGCGSIQTVPSTISPFARMPNPSVNLTRNSVPHLPGSARYAHNALPGKRVTLPRAGYLRR
jgi:hypothetical protein